MATRKAPAAAKNPNLHFVTGSDEAEVRRTAQGLAAKLAPPDSGDFGIETIEAPADTVDCSIEMVERTLQAVLTQSGRASGRERGGSAVGGEAV